MHSRTKILNTGELQITSAWNCIVSKWKFGRLNHYKNMQWSQFFVFLSFKTWLNIFVGDTNETLLVIYLQGKMDRRHMQEDIF